MIWTPEESGQVKNVLLKTFNSTQLPVAIWAFGSRVKGKVKPFSDLDLVVVGEKAMPPGLLWNLREAFSETDLPYRVDVQDWFQIPEHWKPGITSAHEIIFRFPTPEKDKGK
jgi:uncharacterized protein